MGRGSAGSRRARESGNPRVATSGTAPSLSLRAGGAWHSGGCTAVPALCSGVGRLYLSVVIFVFSLLLSVAGGDVCVCGESGRALLPEHPSCHSTWYTKPTAFIFKLGFKKKKKVDLMSCRMSLFVNPLPDAPVTSCYVML